MAQDQSNPEDQTRLPVSPGGGPDSAETLSQDTPTPVPSGRSRSRFQQPSESEQPGDLPSIEGYLILSRLGEGGMGAVYRGVQLATRREVALKLMSQRSVGSERGRRRFEREVELASSLDHPHIARVYDSGLHKGVYFYAMPLVDGLPLDEHVAHHGLGTNAILSLMRKVCEAVGFAHQRGVIHRDLKPSNIMVTADGEPMVLDFGLAKSLETDSESLTLSREGDLAGTPAYMSPEQAAGHVNAIDTRTDVYALGVILYQLLTGRPPIQPVGSMFDVMRRIIEVEPTSPRSIRSDLDRDIEAILLKCLAKDPQERYDTAGALADDIGLFLSGEPITARAPTVAYFLRKRLRKHKVAVGLALAAVAALVLGVTFYILSLNAEKERTRVAMEEAEENAKIANTNALRATEAGELAARRERAVREQLVRVLIEKGWNQLEASDPGAALLLHAEAYRLDAVALANDPSASEQLLPHRLRCAQVMSRIPGLPVVMSHEAVCNEARFLPGDTRIVTASNDSTARVWDARTGRLLHTFAHKAAVKSVAFSRDGQRIATASDDGTARVWDAVTGKPISPPMEHGAAVWEVDLSPDGSRLLTGCANGVVHLHDAKSGDVIHGPHVLRYIANDRILRVGFSPDGKQYFGLNSRTTLAVWNTLTGAEAFAKIGTGESNLHAAYSHDGKRLVTTGVYGYASIWDAATGQRVGQRMEQPPFGSGIADACFSPDDQILVTVGADRCARFWNAATGERLSQFVQLKSAVNCVAYSPLGTHVAVGCDDGTARLYRADNGAPASPVFTQGGGVQSLAFSQDGQKLLLASLDGTARVIPLPKQDPFTTLISGSSVGHLAYSGDGTVLAAVLGNSVMLWDARTKQPLCEPLDQGGNVKGLSVRHDGRQFLAVVDGVGNALWTCGKDDQWTSNVLSGIAATPSAYVDADHFIANRAGGFDVWDARTGERLRKMDTGHLGNMMIATTGSGMFAVGHDNPSVYDAITGKTLCGPIMAGRVIRMRFSPDGKLVATASRDSIARIWRVETGELAAPEMVHARSRWGVTGLAFSPDGNLLATTTVEGYNRLWNVKTGQPVTAPLDSGSMPCLLSFTPDSRTVILASQPFARAWDVKTGLPVSPPLAPSEGKINGWSLRVDGKEAALINGSRICLWELTPSDRPAEDMVAIAQLISFSRIDATGAIVPLSASEAESLRKNCIERFPSWFDERTGK